MEEEKIRTPAQELYRVECAACNTSHLLMLKPLQTRHWECFFCEYDNSGYWKHWVDFAYKETEFKFVTEPYWWN